MDGLAVRAAVVRDGHTYVVLFKTAGHPPEGVSGSVSVSRKPDHDFYPPDKLHLHNGPNSPHFEYIEGARALVARVFTDIQEVLDGKDPSHEPELVNREAVWPEQGHPPGYTVGYQPVLSNEHMEVILEEDFNFDTTVTDTPEWALEVLEGLESND